MQVQGGMARATVCFSSVLDGSWSVAVWAVQRRAMPWRSCSVLAVP
jgi:hypothetical protein